MEENKLIESFNEELPEFFLSDLEERLETDPLNVSALVTLQTNMSAAVEGCAMNRVCERGDCLPLNWCTIVWGR